MSFYVFKYDLRFNPHLEILVDIFKKEKVYLEKNKMKIFSPKVNNIPIQNLPTEIIKRLKEIHSLNISTDSNIFKDLKNIYWTIENKNRELLENINRFEKEVNRFKLEKKPTILLLIPENIIYNKSIIFKDYRQIRVSYRELDLAIFFLSFKITDVKALMDIYFKSEFPVNNDIKEKFISTIQYFIPFARIFLNLVKEIK